MVSVIESPCPPQAPAHRGTSNSEKPRALSCERTPHISDRAVSVKNTHPILEWKHMCVIPALGRYRQRIRHSRPCSKFKAGLSYMSSCLKRQKQNTTTKPNQTKDKSTVPLLTSSSEGHQAQASGSAWDPPGVHELTSLECSG